ncbi:MAG: NAD(P)/FAD-dependent oxidoreductase [Spirochaetaceae bacterium]|jgi:2-enoate reductase|nr:NAD(P)/FAD-dependent oxidoreductase [Spirochaetaceae bacterium]
MKTDAQVQQWVNRYGDWFLREGALERARMTKELYPYDSLFSSITINRLTVKNRLVMAPMGNISMCDETGRPNEKMLQYFYERAQGGVGLITTGLVPVSHGLDNSITELGELSYFPRIDRSRSVFAGWRDLAQGVHSFGARIFIQVTPGLGRVGNPQCLLTMFKLPNSASWNPSFYIPAIPCAPLSDLRLRRIIKNMGQASVDAKTAGLDGTYLHGHEGYLLEQMTNPAFNRRRLGAYADWQAFGLDCVREIRKRVGPHFPVMYRIDLSLALNETYGETMTATGSLKKFTRGRGIEETLDYMKNLVAAGVDIFDVDLGCYDNWWLPHPPAGMPPGCFLEVSRLVKEHFAANGVRSNAGLPVPVVGVGKLGYPDLAEQALRDGSCDMVMLGRPLLADPEWPAKAFAGRTAEITPCIGCQEGCINEFVEGGHPQCAVNPRTGFEHVFPALPPPAENPGRIAVVGGGPAGIVAAVTAARRGHQVELICREAELGGRLRAGGTARIKYEVANYRSYLEGLVERTKARYGLRLLLNTTATVADLKARGFDAIVFALGTRDLRLSLPGIDQARTVQAAELLLKPELLAEAKRIVVVGGGVVGCEAAYFLRYEKNCEVTVVEMDKYIMNHTCTANRGHLIHYLQKGGVGLLNCTRVTGFAPGEVLVARNVSKTVPDPYITWHPILPENVENPLAPKLKVEEREERLPADLVVLAAGGIPEDALYFAALRERAAPAIYNIGDSFAAGKVLEATRAAYRLGLAL